MVAASMRSVAADIGPELKLCVMRTVGGFLKQAAAAVDGGVFKLEESVKSLEDERTKIESFKRELPLCMLLLSDVIEILKKELERCHGERSPHSFKEFIPIRGKCEEGTDCKDKTHWMISAQLWSPNSSETVSDDTKSVKDERRKPLEKNENSHMESKRLSPFAMDSKVEVNRSEALPDLSLLPSAVKSVPFPLSAIAEDHSDSSSGHKRVERAPVALAGIHLSLQLQQQPHQPQRKTRRCWSPELHRRFVLSLQQLGGAQVATPKQIRDLMKVDGLTNDEVKSHLQKYRLHTRKLPNGSEAAKRTVMMLGGLWVPPDKYATSPHKSACQSGSPQSPLQIAASNPSISATAGDSCEEEDERSESYIWG